MNKKAPQARRALRIRKKIRRGSDRARLTVFRSNNHIYAQIIDDVSGKTLLTVSEKQLGKEATGTKTEKAKLVGLEVAKLAALKKVKEVVFDKGRYAYHGRVRAVAEGAREGGLQV